MEECQVFALRTDKPDFDKLNFSIYLYQTLFEMQ